MRERGSIMGSGIIEDTGGLQHIMSGVYKVLLLVGEAGRGREEQWKRHATPPVT